MRFLDGAGIALFLALVERLPAGGWIGLIGPSPNVRRLLHFFGLLDSETNRSLCVFETEEEVAEFLASARLLSGG